MSPMCVKSLPGYLSQEGLSYFLSDPLKDSEAEPRVIFVPAWGLQIRVRLRADFILKKKNLAGSVGER